MPTLGLGWVVHGAAGGTQYLGSLLSLTSLGPVPSKAITVPLFLLQDHLHDADKKENGASANLLQLCKQGQGKGGKRKGQGERGRGTGFQALSWCV